MAKAKYLNGKDLMIFIDGKTVALSKTCKMSISGDTLDTDNKDDGIWKSTDIASMSWQVTSDAVASMDDTATNSMVYDQLFDKMVAHQPIDIIVGVPTNIADGTNGIPEAGWTAPSNDGYTGKAVITALDLQADKGSAGSISITLDGYGALTKLPAE